MVPSDYRLEEVCARLVQRLEASRASFADPEEARAAFHRLATQQVEAALAEYREVARDDRYVERQATLLRQEVLTTFLPRYTDLAVRRTAAERDPARLEAWRAPARRLLLVAGALFGWFFGIRFVGRPLAWLPLLLITSAPLWPDWADFVARRQHRAALQAVVDDMQRIQDQATSYLPPEVLSVEGARPRRTERDIH